MKRKMKVCLITMVVVAIVLFQFSVIAAAPSYTVKYATPSIDGNVKDAEYGPANFLNKNTASVFWGIAPDDTTTVVHFPDIAYRFAWDETALYVGIIAKELDSLTSSEFQIDLSPENKIKDKQRGVFYTFKALNIKDGLVSVRRDNYQSGNSTAQTLNITRKVKSKCSQVSGALHIEVAIPLAELQVKGQGRDLTKITLKAGTWGIGTYFIGNGVALTTTKGAKANAIVTAPGGGLVEYFNPFVLQAKSTSKPK